MNNQFCQQTAITKNDTVTLGGYDWTVLDIQCDRTLMITKEVIEKQAFHARHEVTTWEQCTLRAYLNGAFYSGFSEKEKQRILETVVSNSNNPEYGTNGGNPTTDKVFLLSMEEANRYFSTNSKRVAAYQGAARWWWLRSPGISNHAAFVYSDGFVNAHGYRVDYAYTGVRPAMYLKLD